MRRFELFFFVAVVSLESTTLGRLNQPFSAAFLRHGQLKTTAATGRQLDIFFEDLSRPEEDGGTNTEGGGSYGHLEQCEGDCDYDYDCQGDLICHQRDRGDPIPCCPWGTDGRTDFCAPPTNCKLQLCESDCDYDSDCEDGLICHQRGYHHPPPPCCSHIHPRGNLDYCAPEGDCDSASPSSAPSKQPSSQPSSQPSGQPSSKPSISPSNNPSAIPSTSPSGSPSLTPSLAPSLSSIPSFVPSSSPSSKPSSIPSAGPSAQPSSFPSLSPSTCPSTTPSTFPSAGPSAGPSAIPSISPSTSPSLSANPSTVPSSSPSLMPSSSPSSIPSRCPSSTPSSIPSSSPSSIPSSCPSLSSSPSQTPSNGPTKSPTPLPTPFPTPFPTPDPTLAPTLAPTAGGPSAAPTAEPDGFPCFSKDTTVMVLGKGAVPMMDLEVGDSIWTSSRGSYETVYAFGHYQPEATGLFLVLQTEDGSTVEITGEHLIFVKRRMPNPIRASSVRVGDQLVTPSGSPLIVTKITTLSKEGLYAPLTPSGVFLLANGILVSSYIAVLPNQDEYILLADGTTKLFTLQNGVHFFLSPFRLYCRAVEQGLGLSLGLSSCQTQNLAENGLPRYADWGIRFLNFLQQTNSMVMQCSAIAITFPIFGVATLLEKVFLDSMEPMILLGMLLLSVGLKIMRLTSTRNRKQKTM